MKNLNVSAKISINGNVAVKCAFRVHDGKLFWHGAPKKFAQVEFNKYIWPTNACIGDATALPDADEIQAMVRAYLRANYGIADEKVIISDWAEPKFVNEKNKKRTTEPIATTEPVAEPVSVPEPSSEPTPLPEPEPVSTTPATTFSATPTPTPQAPSQQGIVDAFAALTPLFAGVEANVVASVMAKMQPIIDQLNVAVNTQARVLKVATPNGQTNTVSGATCKGFDAMVQTLTEHEYLYLHGPAGCGKSYTAMQLAEVLGVQFYGLQQVLYEHQITGFVDANGTYHSTPFSEAFVNGGLILLDEFDASSEEAAITINNALANGLLNIPGQGNVKKHEQCYVVAAGNTGCTGADVQYTARRVLDASTVDRFMFIAMDYDEDIELDNAGGDSAIVDFAHDVRQAMEATGLYHLFSYRTIKRLGNVNLQAAYGDAELLRSAFAKALDRDELRLIYSNLKDTNTRWAKALKQLF